jgi:hypothetical protein
MQCSDPGVGKGAFPHPYPIPFSAPRFAPEALASHGLSLPSGASSQFTMAKHLGRLVELLGSSSTPEDFPWAHLDYGRTLRLRQALVARYAPATANLALRTGSLMNSLSINKTRPSTSSIWFWLKPGSRLTTISPSTTTSLRWHA